MITLRPYQESALQDLWDWFERHDDGDPVVEASVGAGKSVMIAECSYSGPLTRDDTCRHCKHLGGTLNNVGSWAESVSHRCKLHDFPVQLGAVCDDHARAAR